MITTLACLLQVIGVCFDGNKVGVHISQQVVLGDKYTHGTRVYEYDSTHVGRKEREQCMAGVCKLQFDPLLLFR